MGHPDLRRCATCEVHKDTSYGKLLTWGIVPRLFDYPFSVPPLRSLAWTLNDAPQADAHCATLTSRILRNAAALRFPRRRVAARHPARRAPTRRRPLRRLRPPPSFPAVPPLRLHERLRHNPLGSLRLRRAPPRLVPA